MGALLRIVGELLRNTSDEQAESHQLYGNAPGTGVTRHVRTTKMKECPTQAHNHVWARTYGFCTRWDIM